MKNNNQNVKNWRNSCKLKMVKSMGGKCQICGYFKCIGALEFHHIDPTTKSFSLAQLIANPKSIKTIAEELKKCILLCSNCHRELHYGLAVIPEEYKLLDEELLLKLSERKKGAIRTKNERVKKINMTKEEFLNQLIIFGNNKSKMAREFNVSEAYIRKLNRRYEE